MAAGAITGNSVNGCRFWQILESGERQGRLRSNVAFLINTRAHGNHLLNGGCFI